jgi:ribosomal protein L11 methyltransferase
VELTQVSVRLQRADADRAEALLNLAGALTLTFDDAADSPLFEPAPGDMPLWPELVIHALFPTAFDGAALGAILRAAVPGIGRIQTRSINEKDWQSGLRQDVFVRRIADNLCVVPANWPSAGPADNVVQLHMGLAFGTGRHPTTLLCLEWLASQPPENLSLCDFGCGSGVLAIAALTLGAERVVAIDNDPQAITATRANAQLNGVTDRLIAGALDDFPDLEVDVVMANILAGTLMQSVTLLAAMLRPGGRIVLSGVLENQTQDVERAFAGRFESFDIAVRDDWARISAILR